VGTTADSDGTGRVTSVENFLEHFGVKGMKWGKRSGGGSSTKEPPSKDAATALALRKRAKTSKPKALTNAELQQAINRMNLEQQFKRLSTNERPVVSRWIASTMLEIGKREVQQAVAKKAVKLATKVAT